MRLIALIKETPKAPLPLPPCENTEKTDIHEQGSRLSLDTKSAKALFSELQSPELRETKFCCFSSLWNFLTAACKLSATGENKTEQGARECFTLKGLPGKVTEKSDI